MFLYLIYYGWDAKMRVYNWKKHNKIKENEFEILLREAVRIIDDSQKPWKEKQYGRRPYPPRSMVLICLLKVYFGMPYRDIESLIRSNKTFQEILKLDKIPDHNTIQRAMAKIPMDYLQGLNQRLTFCFKKRGQILPLMQPVSA
jgi:transposase